MTATAHERSAPPAAGPDGPRRALLADLVLYVVALLFALANARWATLWPHQRWGVWASWAYAVAVLVALAHAVTTRRTGHGDRGRHDRWRVAAVLVAVGGGVVAPLAVLASDRADGRAGTAQSEVGVVEDMGEHVGHGRSPYPSPGAIDAEAARTGVGFKAYRAYEPAMAVFGLPRAWLGDHALTDARVALGLVSAAAVAMAVSIARLPSGRALRVVQLLAVVPPTALTIATGGDDMPVIALCLLSIALASRRRWWACGIAIGIALAMKVIVVPVAVLLAVAAMRPHRRDLGRFLVGAVAVPVVVIVPFAIATPAAVWENIVRYPLGLARFHSSAASALPGHWLVEHAPAGHTLALLLLGLLAVAVMVWIVRRPPPHASDVALVAGVALAAAILALPATRFGYLLYPVCLLGWSRLLRDAGADADPTEVESISGTSARPR